MVTESSVYAGYDNLIDFSLPCRQADFAALVGVSQQAISGLVVADVLRHGQTAGQWMLAYCSRLREQAAGRQSDGELNLVQERAALAREQRIAQELKNAETKKEMAPVALLAAVLAKASQSVSDELEALPAQLKKHVDGLPESAIRVIDESCRRARNNWLHGTGEDALFEIDSEAESDDESEGTGA